MRNSKKITLNGFKKRTGITEPESNYLQKISGGILGACHCLPEGSRIVVTTECDK